MKKEKVWIDCDPGIDDAIMLALTAAYQDQMELLGISASSGNQTAAKVLRNALDLSEYLHLDVPVVQGALEPLIQPVLVADDAHGENGLGDVELPQAARRPAAANGLRYMADRFLGEADGVVTMICTGPLSALALLLKAYPEVRPKIDRVIAMGGSFCGGNMTAGAEFNIWADPEAAEYVLKQDLPIVLLPLDVTEQCTLSFADIESLNKPGTRLEPFYQMLDFYAHSPALAGKEGIAVHDAGTIMYLLNPQMYTGKLYDVLVDTGHGAARGMTFKDIREKEDHSQAHVQVLEGADAGRFKKELLRQLEELGK